MENGIRTTVQLSRGTVQVKPNSGPRTQERGKDKKEFRKEQNPKMQEQQETEML